MKKRLVTLLLIVVMSVVIFALTATAATSNVPPSVCQHCQQPVTWTKLTSADIRDMGPTTTGHYYLELDESLENYNWMGTTRIPAGNEVCLYLNGEWIYGTTEAFTVQNGAVLNIMDDSGNGKITGRGRSTGMRKGGVLNIEKGGTVNLYGGELSYVPYSSRHILDGGVAYVAGELNMYGGKLTGGVAGRADTSAGNGGNVHIVSGGIFTMKDGLISGGKAIQFNSAGGNGGNVYVADGATFIMENGTIQGGACANGGGSIYVAPTASFEMKNGSISGGSADVLGDCVLCRGAMTMSGNASIEELQLKTRTDKGGPELSEMLTINGAYTGTVKLRLDSAVEGLDVGNGVDADLTDAEISIYGSFLSVEEVDGQLMTVGAKSFCEHCQKQVTWTALTEEAADWTSLETGHYYLAFSGESYKFTEKSIYLDQVVCLNLNGKKLIGATRAFSVLPGATLSVMGDGTVSACGDSASKFSGGVVQIQSEGVFNLYSGILDNEEKWGGAVNGGIVSCEGTMNMYGGRLAGGIASNAAGTLFIETTGQLNMYGGTIEKGTAKAANCIYSKGKVLLSGDASIAEYLFKPVSEAKAPALSEMLTISGKYTGTTVLRSISAGNDIGTSDSMDITDANITIYGKSTLQLAAMGSDLIVKDGASAMSMDSTGVLNSYQSAQEAVNACTDSDKTVVLFSDVDSLQINGNVNMDLNGYTVGTISVAESKSLYCMDSATEDYDISDGIYGKIKQYTGAVLAMEASADGIQFLPIQEEDGISFHAVDLRITAMSLRPSEAGIYFFSNFAGDQLLKKQIKQFGVAMSVTEEPTADTLATTAKCTVYDGEAFNSGAENTSSLVYNIFKSDLQDSENDQRANTQIFAKAYICLENGEYVFGKSQSRSLRQQLELANDTLSNFSAAQKATLYSMYGAFGNAMADWEISNIVEGKELEDHYALVEKTATQADIDSLNGLYAGTQAYHGELHDHSMSGPKGDGKQTLEVWKKYMDIIGMDFATLVDHKQAAHMYLDEWDNSMFIGGSEFATWITDYTHTADADGKLHNGVHYNMIFADREIFVEFLKSIPEYKYAGKNVLTDIVPGYPSFTRARMIEIVNTVMNNGGFFTHVHPKSPSYLVSDNPLDYWFVDWTGIEVILSSRTTAVNADNYKLWTDLLALGKKVYATAGSDKHNLPNPETMSTFYTTEKNAQAFLDNLRAGNFTAGMAGIRMSIGDTVMGSQVKEDFTGKRLVFSVGDFHSSLLNGHDYRVDLINDEGIIFSQAISSDETTYFAVEAQNCKFYRVEVYDTTDNVLISMGQPIWNVGA